MRDIEGDPAIIASWNEAMKNQRLEKAMENQSIDLISLASTPMHDRLTFECAQAVEEKMAERLRKGAPGKVYQGWMAEIDRKVSHHERRGERNPPSKKRKRPSRDGCVSVFWNMPTFFENACKVPMKRRLVPKARAQLRHGNDQFPWTLMGKLQPHQRATCEIK